MSYFDGDGNIVVPKSVRPIIDYEETNLGTPKGSIKQYRYGNLHIREYETHYTVHSDKIDPRKDPVGHLLVDAPECLLGLTSAISIGQKAGSYVYKSKMIHGKDSKSALRDALVAGYVVGSAAGAASYLLSIAVKKFARGI